MDSRFRSISLALLGVLTVGGFTLGAPRAAWAQDEENAEPPAEEGSAETGSGEAGEAGSGEADDGTSIARPTNKRRWGVGARFRYVFLPAGVLELFLDHATSLSSVGFGAEVVGRKGNFDLVFGIEYDSASPEDGLYQDKGDDPGDCGTNADTCPDFTHFDGLGMIALDANFIWHTKLADKIDLRYGGGLGIGIVTGAIYQTKRFCPANVETGDLDDPNSCPTTLPGESEKKSDDVPPVVPIVSLLLGVKFQVTENIGINVETGFRDVFFLGAGTDWIF
jgi:hypothetical protein